METWFITRTRATRGSGDTGRNELADGDHRTAFPTLLTVDEAAHLLRTTRRAIYAMIERRQLPGVIRIRRRVSCAPMTCYTGRTRSARHRRRSNRR